MSRFEARTILPRVVAGQELADAIALPDGHQTLLACTSRVPPEAFALGDGAGIVRSERLGQSSLHWATGLGGAGDSPETALFDGLDAILALRNGESAAIAGDWLAYHAARHGAQGAVIVDRARPDEDEAFGAELAARLAEGIDGIECVLWVRLGTPMGEPGLPPEAHPFCVPEAPGRGRMVPPPPDPWRAPLGFRAICEVMRARYLATARAVACFDLHDLVVAGEGGTLFDRAAAAEAGIIALSGRHCFPWRVRPDTPVHFGDHACIQFDGRPMRRRWCIAPAKAAPDVLWDITRIRNAKPGPEAPMGFYRHMALRHPTDQVSKLVPKSSLIEWPALRDQARELWAHEPVRIPEEQARSTPDNGRRAIVTCMKNEGPFILEWLAWHRAVGFDDVLVYSNDCTDGTDRLLDLLQDKGLVQHRQNPFRGTGQKPQHAALQAAEDEPVIRDAAWVVSMDVDEFVNIKTGDGTLDALFDALPDANMISMTWRLFGNADTHAFADDFVTRQFTRAAPEMCRKPHQAWGFKTLFRNLGHFKKLGVHRPKGLKPQFWQELGWVNGSGRPLPRGMYRNAWRSTVGTVGYDLVQLNHYAVRSVESFLVKRDRGRVNHTDRDQGKAYWFRMNNNAEEERSIQRHLPMLQAEWDRLMADPEIAAAHADCVTRHRARIAQLRALPDYARLFEELASPRMQRLSRMHTVFGANVFLAGPDVVPDALLTQDVPEGYYFTVERGETSH